MGRASVSQAEDDAGEACDMAQRKVIPLRLRKKAAPPVRKKTKQSAQKHETNSLRKVETRRKILAAARRLFTEYGYHGTTPDRICKIAGVAHGTFYFHFEDKLDCFLSFNEDAAYELHLVNQWYEPEGEAPREMFEALLRSSFDYSLANPGVMKALFSDFGVLSKDSKYVKRLPHGARNWADLLDKWKQRGEASPDCDRLVFTYMLMGTILRGSNLVARDPESLDKVVESMTRFLARMIRD